MCRVDCCMWRYAKHQDWSVNLCICWVAQHCQISCELLWWCMCVQWSPVFCTVVKVPCMVLLQSCHWGQKQQNNRMLCICAAVLMLACSKCQRPCVFSNIALATSTSTDAGKYEAAAWACCYCHSSCTCQDATWCTIWYLGPTSQRCTHVHSLSYCACVPHLKHVCIVCLHIAWCTCA